MLFSVLHVCFYIYHGNCSLIRYCLPKLFINLVGNGHSARAWYFLKLDFKIAAYDYVYRPLSVYYNMYQESHA
jgi:hypothetical protein